LLDLHDKDCLWVDMRRDAQLCVESSIPRTTANTERSSIPSNSPPQANLYIIQSPIQDQSPKSPSHEPTAFPQVQSTPPTPSVEITKPTYASVLKSPSRSHPPQPHPKSPTMTPQSPSSCSKNTPTPIIYQSSPTTELPRNSPTPASHRNSPTPEPHRNSPPSILSVEDLR
jgi:hypothetical protein